MTAWTNHFNDSLVVTHLVFSELASLERSGITRGEKKKQSNTAQDLFKNKRKTTENNKGYSVLGDAKRHLLHTTNHRP